MEFALLACARSFVFLSGRVNLTNSLIGSLDDRPLLLPSLSVYGAVCYLRHPAYPGDVPHEYNDKYVLAEFLTSTCLAAEINALEYLGLSADHLQQLREWSAEKAVTLRFSTEERCAFDRKETRKVESDTERVTSLKMGDYAAKITNKVRKSHWRGYCQNWIN